MTLDKHRPLSAECFCLYGLSFAVAFDDSMLGFCDPYFGFGSVFCSVVRVTYISIKVIS